jgi:GH43 family beta-xylosidase
VWIDKAQQLQDIHSSTAESATVRAWTAPGGTAYSTMIWAPELHQINGKWYIYVAAAANNDNDTHRMYVLERDNPDPFGSYTFKGQIAAATDRWAIDGTVLQWQGKLYFIWSGWPGASNGRQNLYIAEMSNPWTISGDRVLLSEPQSAWEMHGMPINEGPEVLIHDGQLHIIYSGSGYWTQQYALGRLTYDGTGSVMDRANWVKASSPVFQQAGQVVGVGHASFTTSPDGTQDWIVYHSHPSPGGDPDQRVVRIQPFTWFANGTPNFSTPLPSSTILEAPSGLADADRPLVQGDYDGSGAVNYLDLEVYQAQTGLAIFPGVSADGNGDGSIDGADFLLWQRQLGAPATSQASATAVSIDQLVPSASPVTAEPNLRGLSGLSPFASSRDSESGSGFVEPANVDAVDAAIIRLLSGETTPDGETDDLAAPIPRKRIKLSAAALADVELVKLSDERCARLPTTRSKIASMELT